MNPLSNLRFARPSFIEGVARILDLGSTLNTYNELTDEEAIAADWAVVGQDMWQVIGMVNGKKKYTRTEAS